MKKWCGCAQECAHPDRCNPHCPHDTQTPWTGTVQSVPILCCHCGIQGIRRKHYTRPPGHGPYALETFLGEYLEWKETDPRGGL